MRSRTPGRAWIGAILFICGCSGGMPAKKEVFPSYVSSERIRGSLNVYGEMSQGNVHALLLDAFSKVHPGVKVYWEGTIRNELFLDGPRYGEEHLVAFVGDPGGVQIEKIRRKLKTESEGVLIAIYSEKVYVVVHPSNPMQLISVGQLKQIFGDVGRERLLQWGDLGVVDKTWQTREVGVLRKHERTLASRVFQESVLGGGKFGRLGRVVRGGDMGKAIGKETEGIGYTNIWSDEFKVLKVVDGDGRELEVLENGGLSRRAYVYLPGGLSNRVHREYVRFILSREGQEVLRQLKNVRRLSVSEGSEQLSRLGGGVN